MTDFKTPTRSMHKSLTDIDYMDGREFELFVGDLLKKLSYKNVSVTQQSGDQGVDVIAFQDDLKIAFQCKHYSQHVGNRAVQELFSGSAFYDCSRSILVTNNYFTDSAQQLASKLDIELWNRNTLKNLILKSTPEDIKS
ncbi:restriction endonuclease [Levilactobacillus brevis]|uniref:restriction endonuclease n=1 Tax=Levilactobacillus brevis TaxID=1580 RepID=UPI0021A86284|nr:restriction endonuclease [Levilactobacillus brevis]MCT3567228.1 restriction endonuclease [Levilactobacillus brevis]